MRLPLTPLMIMAGIVLSALACTQAALAAPAPVALTLLHTNDVHSHFRGEKTQLQLGGIARLKTVIQAARAENPASLLVDGGDWSEGQIYYVEGGGAESLKMMDLLGYDAAVVGNHDWLNGPDRLLEAARAAKPKLTLIGANFEMSGYSHSDAFFALIHGYAIKQVSGVKVAFVGLANFDPIYGSYLAPVKSVDPTPIAQRLAQQLKSQHLADIVVGVSHNAIGVNRSILQAAPDLDLIIGAHDHQKLTQPEVVSRPGHPDAWVVEAGRWGQYLGKVDIEFVPSSAGSPAALRLRSYRLIQVDRNVPEDAAVKARVEALEARIEAKMGPVFRDHIADCDMEVTGEGMENMIGDLVADAYRQATGADVAIDQNRLIYGALHEGAIDSADVFNVNPAIYNLVSGKSWTLYTWTMSGSTASMLFKLLYTWRKISETGGLVFSGLEVMYDPLGQKDNLGGSDLLGGLFSARGNSPVHSLTIQGRAIDPNQTYKFAASAGIVAAIQVINQKYFNIIAMDDLKDTGLEDWAVVRDYVHSISPINPSKIAFGGRVRTWQPDLGIVPGSLRWTPILTLDDGSIQARVELQVSNFGGNASPADGVTVNISSNDHGVDGSVEGAWTARGTPQSIPSLQAGASRAFVWEDVVVPSDRGLYMLNAFVHTSGETNGSNDGLTRYFKP